MDKKQLNDSLASIKNSSADRIILPGKKSRQETLDPFQMRHFSALFNRDMGIMKAFRTLSVFHINFQTNFSCMNMMERGESEKISTSQTVGHSQIKPISRKC